MDRSWKFIFIWASVLLCLKTADQSAPVNVARGGVASQSSFYSAAIPASLAIDGNANPSFWAGSCISTVFQQDPWWMLDLRAPYAISAIEVTRRTDCCIHDLALTEIRVGNSPENNGNNNPRCAVITITVDYIMTFDCNQMEGRYVSFNNPGSRRIVQFCEVKVFPTLTYGVKAFCPDASCSRDYILIQNEPKTWMEAQAYCRKRFTDLSTISSVPDMNTAIEQINSKRLKVELTEVDDKHDEEHFWIGMYEGSLTWRWSLSDDGYYGDGEAEFRNWDVDQPNENPVIQHCVGIDHTGVWKDLDCNLTHYFLCYDARDRSPATKILVETPMNWTGAQLYCREHHTDLLSVRNLAENQEIQSMVPSGMLAWIGLSGDPWNWSDGTKSSFRYEWQTPLGEGPNCVYIHNGKWSVKSCDTESMFLCYYFKKRSVFKISTNFDMSDSLIQQQMLSQLEAKMKSKNIGDFKISWRTKYTEK